MESLNQKKNTHYDKLHEASPQISPENWAYFVLLDNISDQIAEFMDEHGISKAELSRRMEVKPAYISRLLGGDANPTLKTLSKVFYHLDVKLHTSIVDSNDTDEVFLLTRKTYSIKDWNFSYEVKRSSMQHRATWGEIDKELFRTVYSNLKDESFCYEKR